MNVSKEIQSDDDNERKIIASESVSRHGYALCHLQKRVHGRDAAQAPIRA